MAHHVPRIARLGAWVLISEGWYQFFPVRLKRRFENHLILEWFNPNSRHIQSRFWVRGAIAGLGQTARFVNEHALCPLVQVAGLFGGVVLLFLGHALANFNIALPASASASRRVAYECGDRR